MARRSLYGRMLYAPGKANDQRMPLGVPTLRKSNVKITWRHVRQPLLCGRMNSSKPAIGKSAVSGLLLFAYLDIQHRTYIIEHTAYILIYIQKLGEAYRS